MMEELPRVEFTQHVLDNGLRVILHEQRGIPLVYVTIHYRVGSAYEERGRSGFAHLFEHLMFQGSGNVGRNEHGRHVDAAGGRWNATTSKDRTNYFETLPSNSLDLGLWLESDRMLSLQITQENFENQRSTVIEEKKQSYDNRPYGRPFLRFDEIAYQNWAYAHPIIGDEEDLLQAELDDVLAFHANYYGPGNATLVLAGDFESGPALEKVERYFGAALNGQDVQKPDLTEPEQTEARSETMQDPLAPLPAAFVGYHMPALGTPDYYALTVLALTLSHGQSSRLYRLLIHEKNWVAGLSAGPNGYLGPQIFRCWFQAQDGAELDRIVEVIERELQRLCLEPISGQELEKVRNQLLFRLVESRKRISGVGEGLARYDLFFDDAERINREIDRYLRVGPEEIMEAARRTFQPMNQIKLMILPG